MSPRGIPYGGPAACLGMVVDRVDGTARPQGPEFAGQTVGWPMQWGGPADEDDEASIRLLLDAPVSRLKQQPQELARRTVRQGSEAPDRGRP